MRLSNRTCNLVFAATTVLTLSAEINKWPAIQPAQGNRTFVEPGRDGTDTPFLFLLKDADGVPVYKLECHNGNYEDSSELNFSGDFQCALFAVTGDERKSWNLLATKTEAEQKSDWLNRGRMTSNQLRGQCGAVPEYGTIRHFRLRGMLITFRFSNLEWSKVAMQGDPKLKQFTFDVSVSQDSNARTETADRIEAPTPPKACT
jgi:hypothetical protein